MNDNEILDLYFSRKKEMEFNKLMLSVGYKEIEEDVRIYVDNICSIPVKIVLDYINNKCPKYIIEAKDVYQFSKFKDTTDGVCSVLLKNNSEGIGYKELGERLQNDGKERTDLAKAKYGENHFKMAEELGLGFREGRHDCYLSAIGNLFLEMEEETKRCLLTRLILRSKLIVRLYKEASKGEVRLEILLYDLSESTYIRRRTNVRTVIEELKKTTEFDFEYFATKIIY